MSEKQNYEAKWIDVSKLTNWKGNRDLDPSNKLTRNIAENGFAHPLEVFENEEGEYEVTDGWQRCKAAQTLGIDEVPCRVWDDSFDAMGESSRNDMRNIFELRGWNGIKESDYEEESIRENVANGEYSLVRPQVQTDEAWQKEVSD